MRTDVRHHPSAALVCASSSKAWTCSGRSASSHCVGRSSDCSEFSWSQYQPITKMRTTMYTHGTGREESMRVR
eukprot:2261511-Prymnesium_polylepis.1